ncbi:MAG: RAMP superfamily CRISPR-associated protein [Myxococcales bacterium]|jgi:CRISPR/Cas system CSM-associated protein Csm3 (group 7 of RAMP superfamily)
MSKGQKVRGARLAVARVTIEALTPFVVGTGGGDDLRDSVCVSDANGLPTIPGSTIAGVLRHALAGGADPDVHPECRSLFGYQRGNEGASSRLEVSWAQVHDEDDRPVPFRGAHQSSFLAFLAGGVERDHVRLNARGAVDGKGKFDETLVAAGARFTFELVLEDPGDGELEKVLGLLARPELRLGGRSRRGFGAFEVVRVRSRVFDLHKPDERQAWALLPRALHEDAPSLPLASKPESAKGQMERILVELQPEDYWIFGGGVPIGVEGARERDPDILPVTEECIVWEQAAQGEKGRVGERRRLVPASSVKGALRHRTAFHARRFNGAWAKPGEDVAKPAEPAEVVELFGDANSNSKRGRPGCVYLRDVYLKPEKAPVGYLDHVCIDRFTGAPMDGMLFSEAPLHGVKGKLELEILVESSKVSDEAKKAFDAALEDLVSGRLALGAGANRGHGYFKGTIRRQP